MTSIPHLSGEALPPFVPNSQSMENEAVMIVRNPEDNENNREIKHILLSDLFASSGRVYRSNLRPRTIDVNDHQGNAFYPNDIYIHNIDGGSTTYILLSKTETAADWRYVGDLSCTFVIDTVDAMDKWSNNTADYDYTAVYIKSGTWTLPATRTINLTTVATKKVTGDPLSVPTINFSSQFIKGASEISNIKLNMTTPDAGLTELTAISSSENLDNVEIAWEIPDPSISVYGFSLCNKMKSCKVTGSAGSDFTAFWQCNEIDSTCESIIDYKECRFTYTKVIEPIEAVPTDNIIYTIANYGKHLVHIPRLYTVSTGNGIYTLTIKSSSPDTSVAKTLIDNNDTNTDMEFEIYVDAYGNVGKLGEDPSIIIRDEDFTLADSVPDTRVVLISTKEDGPLFITLPAGDTYYGETEIKLLYNRPIEIIRVGTEWINIGSVINDEVVSAETTWSSYKIDKLTKGVVAAVNEIQGVMDFTEAMTPFSGLSQTFRQWSGMTTQGTDVYACVNFSGDIYKQTNGTGDFIALGQETRNWRGMTSHGDDVYACVSNGDIYKQTGGAGDFIALGQTSRNWSSMTTLGDTVYACVSGGDIYKQTNGTGDFVALGQTSRRWSGMTTLGNDVYACVSQQSFPPSEGDIYKQTNGTGDFIALGQTSRRWSGMTTLGSDVYACVSGGDIYKQTNGTGDFIALGQTSRQWSGMTSHGDYVYVSDIGGDIYTSTILTGNTYRTSSSFTLPAMPDGARKRILNTNAATAITVTAYSGTTIEGQATMALFAGHEVELELIGTDWKKTGWNEESLASFVNSVNAGTATKLATPITINGVSFDGSADITVADSTKAPLASPAFTGTPTINGETLPEIIQNTTDFGKTTLAGSRPYYADQAAFDEASLKAGFYAVKGDLVGGAAPNDGGAFTMIGQNDTRQFGWDSTNTLRFRSTDTPSASTWSEWYTIWHSGNDSALKSSVRIGAPSSPQNGDMWIEV